MSTGGIGGRRGGGEDGFECEELLRERRKIDDDENSRVGGLVVIVVDSVAVNIRKSLDFFTPFESSKLGTLSSSFPFLEILSSPPCSYSIKCIRYLPCYYLFSSFLRTKISRNKLKKNKTNFALGRIDIFIDRRKRKKKRRLPRGNISLVLESLTRRLISR